MGKLGVVCEFHIPYHFSKTFLSVFFFSFFRERLIYRTEDHYRPAELNKRLFLLHSPSAWSKYLSISCDDDKYFLIFVQFSLWLRPDFIRQNFYIRWICYYMLWYILMPKLHAAVVQTSMVYLRVVTWHNIHYVVTQQKGLAKDTLHVNGSMWGSPVRFFYSAVSMVIFSIAPPAHTFNPE